ncbi:uncharacterized protein LOC126571709 [Anopheles aquasalis]|uniref:uncharacterized protein LOC126571709 n=1 Tax=Anopheles aquasalis TaxID=42839 RepID=UPI00215AEFCF|nr:uncharacterized protein LOC126571709 [Anopheles aquasalis]
MNQYTKLMVLMVILFSSVLCCESAISGDRLVFHVPINYKNVHMTKTRIKPVHHRTYQKTDFKVLGYSADKPYGSFVRQLTLVLLLTAVLASGSRASKSKKHNVLSSSSTGGRWQSRALLEGASSRSGELQMPHVKPAPFSKPSHAALGHGSSTKRAYYLPTVTNFENKLHHFINNLKTGIGSSKLAHAVNGVTSSLQQQLTSPGAAGAIANLLPRPSALHSAAGYYGVANELRYGQPFVSKQTTGSHFKTAPATFGKGGKRGRHSATASPPGKYDSLMSDLGISGYKHFENSVIRDLERREELKVEATIHTLFPEDDGWRPIASNRKPVSVKAPVPEHSEPKGVTVAPEKSRPTALSSVRPSKGKLTSVGSSTAPKPTVHLGQKTRSKGTAPMGKDKRTKDRSKCWNCVGSTSSSAPGHGSSSTVKIPVAFKNASTAHRHGPAYDASMFYGSDGRPPAAVGGSAAQSYSNIEVHYNRTLAPPFAASPWTQPLGPGLLELSTQPAPPVTTFSVLPETVAVTNVPVVYGNSIKKSFSKHVKPYGPPASYVGHPADTPATSSTTTHNPTGASQGTKATTKKRPAHKQDSHGLGAGHLRRPLPTGKASDISGSASSKHEQRVKKKFDPKYSRNRGSIKFKDALKQNPDQLYR